MSSNGRGDCFPQSAPGFTLGRLLADSNHPIRFAVDFRHAAFD